MQSSRSTAGSAAVLAILALGAFAAPVQAQQHSHDHGGMTMPAEGYRAELIRDIEQLERKYLALAEAMTEHYAWRPGAGVRSASEVLMHIAAANFMIPGMAGVPAPENLPVGLREMESVTDPATVRELLDHSFRHAKHAIARTPDAELDTMTKLFGQDATKRAVLHLLVAHMHEHLGQSIAYARVNGVVPPWSAAADN